MPEPIPHTALIPGHTYEVRHSRKGSFTMKLIARGDTWIDGVVEGGKASAMMQHNEKILGDPITVRASHCVFYLSGKVRLD